MAQCITGAESKALTLESVPLSAERSTLILHWPLRGPRLGTGRALRRRAIRPPVRRCGSHDQKLKLSDRTSVGSAERAYDAYDLRRAILGLRNGFQLLERRCKCIRETPDRPWSELLVLRLEVEVMHGARRVFRSFQFALPKRLKDDYPWR